MTHDEQSARVEVLEQRLPRLGATLALLLDAVADGNAAETARELREVLGEDLEADSVE